MRRPLRQRALPTRKPRVRQRGFTLIELLIAVAIVAILSAVAVPLYSQYQLRTLRTTGQSDLQLCAQGMERFAGINFTYEGAADGGGDTGAPASNVCSATSPSAGGDTIYNLSIQAADGDSYTLRATPVAGSLVAADGMLELDSSGDRRWDRNNDGDFEDSNETTWQE